ncbi:hypothetical protein [Nostoc sp. UHCC 0252]|nr:hypothetical protein [Nostoc sp. UHCC 0252]MEA5604792.1 hypothetical protein [Nostoc sp. UHCC 0252]
MPAFDAIAYGGNRACRKACGIAPLRAQHFVEKCGLRLRTYN